MDPLARQVVCDSGEGSAILQSHWGTSVCLLSHACVAELPFSYFQTVCGLGWIVVRTTCFTQPDL